MDEAHHLVGCGIHDHGYRWECIAAADPVNSRNAEVFPVMCNGQTYTVVVKSGTPAHIVGSTRNIIPVAFTFTATDETGEVVFSGTEGVGQGKRVGLQDDLITCTTAFTESDPETGEEDHLRPLRGGLPHPSEALAATCSISGRGPSH